MSVNDDVQAIIETVRELRDRAAQERLAAAWSGTGDPVYVTGGSTSRPTEARAMNPGRTDADRIDKELASIRKTIEKFAAKVRPREGGGQCVTKGCVGPATHHSRCFECWRWIRANPGFTPDQARSIDPETGKPIPGRTLVDDFNDRRRRDCACTGWMDHPVTGERMPVPGCDHTSLSGDRCRNRISPSDRHLECSSCRGRVSRVLEAEREAS